MTTFMMVFTMGGTAFAADDSTHSISLSSGDTHTYRVFQVLTGTLAEEGDNQLGNPVWGADVIANPGSVDAFIAQITATNTTEEQIASLVAAKVNTDGDGRGTVDKDHPITGLATGYYVLVDVTELDQLNESSDTRALHVVKVLNDVTDMAIKWETTEVNKIIASDTLGKDGDDLNTINGKNDNVSVGDTVNYQITAKVPENANQYNYFIFVINDTLDNGLTLEEDSIKVYKDSVKPSNLLAKDTNYGLKTGADAGDFSFQVGLKGAKSYANKNIIVTYSAVLNENANIGSTSNDNTSTVTYSNNPNHNYNGENNPAFPASVDDDAMGETPASVTKTYTTGIEIAKVDQDNKVLTGAKFTLSGTSIKSVVTEGEVFEEDENGTYYKLNDGTYTTDEPTTEGQYMVLTDGATSGYVIDASYDGEDKVIVDGTTYRPYAPATDEGQDVYVLHNGNADLYTSTEIKYKKTTGKVVKDVAENHSIELAVNENGIVEFDGLGAGIYTITETQTPAGYNTIDPIQVTISFDNNTTDKWSITGIEGSSYENGVFKITIKNNKGTALPSTGGIGTTIFYIVGGIMVAGAVVFLLTKRRMVGNE
jgi:fimbrial isopeptide formation D2 family protein/LPXTG-motif cell wall-anchored protein